MSDRLPRPFLAVLAVIFVLQLATLALILATEPGRPVAAAPVCGPDAVLPSDPALTPECLPVVPSGTPAAMRRA